MAKFNYYGVAAGRSLGVYKTWAECEAQVKSFNGAKFRGFNSQSDAEAFARGEEQAASNVEAPGIDDVSVYVDGSFIDGKYAWAFVAYKDDKEIHCACGVGNHAEAASMQNVAGELSAAMRAVKWANDELKNDITIYHDYKGISAWLDGSWKAKNSMTQAYVKFMCGRKGYRFVKVKGHSGVRGNERADELCREAFANALA